MRMLTGRVAMEFKGMGVPSSKAGFSFDLECGKLRSQTTTRGNTVTSVRAVRDPIARVPQDDKIIALLLRTLTRAQLSEDSSQWEIKGMTGDTYMLSLGAPYELWVIACEGLLKKAMNNDST